MIGRKAVLGAQAVERLSNLVACGDVRTVAPKRNAVWTGSFLVFFQEGEQAIEERVEPDQRSGDDDRQDQEHDEKGQPFDPHGAHHSTAAGGLPSRRV